MFKNKKIYVAPMMQYTDKHDRYFLRLISKNVILFTEMIPTNTIIHGDKDRYLQYNKNEHPIILQLGGSNADDMALCAEIAEKEYKYDGININVGCPSRKVVINSKNIFIIIKLLFYINITSAYYPYLF